MSVLAELRRKHPAKAKRADHGTSLRAALDLKCLDCAGGSRAEVRDCTCYACPLWPHRPYAESTTRPVGAVPTAEEYDAMAADAETDAQRAAREVSGERLRAMRGVST